MNNDNDTIEVLETTDSPSFQEETVRKVAIALIVLASVEAAKFFGAKAAKWNRARKNAVIATTATEK